MWSQTFCSTLLSAHGLLSRPGPAQRPEEAILTAALDGRLDQKALDKLLPAAAAAAMVNTYRGELARQSEHVLVGAFHRAMEAGAADEIIASMRPQFDRHAEAIAVARSLFTAESTPEHVLASAEPGSIEAWQQLNGHLAVVAKIGAVASQFCPRNGNFPQVREYALGDGFRLDDRAIAATAGPLATDSALFQRPDQGHRTSPWARTELRLHSIAEAQARYNEWAVEEFDRQHSGPRGGWIDENGKMHEHPAPENPYRTKVST